MDMVLCFIALPVFLILGLFSIKYRKLALESWDCMFRTITLRKCRSGLDERIKSDVTGKLMKASPSVARAFYRNYKIISWIILIIFILATYYSALGLYNYYAYGNCNGPDSNAFCIFTEIGNNVAGNYDVAKIAKDYGLDEAELVDCLERNKELGEACLSYCLDNL